MIFVYSYSLDFHHHNTYSISNTHTNALKNTQAIFSNYLAYLGLKYASGCVSTIPLIFQLAQVIIMDSQNIVDLL